MSNEKYYRLARHLKEQPVDVRGVVRYQNDDVELLYSRGDVDASDLEERVVVTVRRAVARDRSATSSDVAVREHVEQFDEVLVGHLREGPNEGVVFSIEPGEIEDVQGFVESCRNSFEGDREPAPKQSVA